MINRYDVVQPLQFQFSETPVSALAATLERKQKMFDVNRALADNLSDQYIDALPQDRARANALQQDIQYRIDNVVARNKGDYSRITSDLYSLKRDITRQFKPGGEAFAIQANKAAYEKSKEYEQERLAKGDINESQLQAWNNYTMRTYKGVGTKDPATGNYNILNPEQISKYYDPIEIGMEIAKEMEPFAEDIKYDQVSGDWIVTTGSKTEILPKEYIQGIVGNRLLQHEGYKSFLTQQQKFFGRKLTDQQLQSLAFDSVGAIVGEAFQRYNTSSERSLKERGYGLAAYKSKLQQQMMESLYGTTFGPATQGPGSKFRPISKSQFTGGTEYIEQPSAIGFGLAPGTTRPKIGEQAEKFDYSKFAYSKEAALNNNLDQELLQQVVENNPKKDNEDLDDYNSKIENLYNTSGKANSNVFQNRVYYLNKKMSDALRDGLINNALLGGQANIRIDKNGQVSEPMSFEEAKSELGIKDKDMWDDKGNPIFKPINIHSGGSSHAGAITLAVPGKSNKRLIIEDWSAEVEQASMDFRQLSTPKRGELTGFVPISFDSQGNPIGISSTREFVPKDDGTVQEKSVIKYTKIGNGDKIEEIKDQSLLEALPQNTTVEYWAEQLGYDKILQQYVPKGAAKSDYTQIPLN